MQIEIHILFWTKDFDSFPKHIFPNKINKTDSFPDKINEKIFLTKKYKESPNKIKLRTFFLTK